MDRPTMLEHLAMAERHVEGELHLARQKALIAERSATDTILRTLARSLRRCSRRSGLTWRDRILKEQSSRST